ncbi:heme o synthase [Archaeoglobus veneficus]|uniref:Protoheme IX farnesyltransferase n=1 Tax=Archaeoglobus veneficus (strain DSM 11195 / SNP6) TaxID=693661 RepID=F2KNM4_ARCVS|nr:heme o synthase [Archaeoglobus veneficus]AEA46252.1 Protoheme IX farnesyltransferase [Archaeoglobus veneficus SNP6]
MPDARSFLEVIKPKQTTLLMVTCVVAYTIALKLYQKPFLPSHFAATFTATILAVAGTTALNMWLDSDIDALMCRTRHRPVPSGRLSPVGCALYGLVLFVAGFGLGLLVNAYLALVLLLGLFFDIIVYTIMLKRKSPYSIVLGGLAGAMPCLAGWTAAAGRIELAGILAAAIILLWIPAHIWYLSMYFEEDYRNARIPMLPLVVGMERASWAIVLSVAFMLVTVAVLFFVAPLSVLYFVTSTAVVSYFLYRAVKFALSPSREKAKQMYKLASITLGVVYLSMLIGTISG